MPFDSVNYQPTDPMLKGLQAARQWLSANPTLWAKYNAFEKCGDVRRCALNATAQAMSDTGLGSYCDAADLLCQSVPAPFTHVADFNDHPATTHADILALFDRAIALRRAEIASKERTEAKQ